MGSQGAPESVDDLCPTLHRDLTLLRYVNDVVLRVVWADPNGLHITKNLNLKPNIHSQMYGKVLD